MKPNLQTTETNRHGEARGARAGSSLPKIESYFQAPFSEFSRGSGGGKGRPSFRGISAGYFASEARSHFAVEALMFGVIVMTAAVPVIEGVRGVFQFVYGML